MQIYKTFLKLSIRKAGTCIFYFVILIGICFMLSKSQNSYTPEKISLAVIDKDNSELSKALYNYIDTTQNIEEVGDESTWPDYFFYHTVDYILIINDGFEENIMNGNLTDVLSAYKVPESGTTYIASTKVSSFVQNLSFYIKSGYSKEDAIENAVSTSNISTDVSFSKSALNSSVSVMGNFFTFLPYVIVSIMINCLGIMLVLWNKPEIRKRNEISKQSLVSRNTSLICAMLTYTLILFGLFTLIACVLFGDELFCEAGMYYILNSAIYTFVCIGITLLVAEFSKKSEMLSLFSNIIALASSFLCGVFVSRGYLPEKVVSFSKCLPTYWYINITEELNYYDGSLSQNAWTSMIVQIAFGFAFICIGLMIIKFRQQKKVIA